MSVGPATEQRIGGAKTVANMQDQQNWNRGRNKRIGRAKVELVARVKDVHVVSFEGVAIYYENASNGNNFAAH